MRYTKPKNLCGILNSDLYPLVPDKGTKSQLTQCYQTVTDNSQCLLFVFSNCLVGWNVTRPNLVYFNEKRIFIEIILPDIFCLTGDMPELYQGSMGYIFFFIPGSWFWARFSAGSNQTLLLNRHNLSLSCI